MSNPAGPPLLVQRAMVKHTMTHFSWSQACIIVLCMLNSSFQAYILYNLILMYLWLSHGPIALYGVIKNVIGQLQSSQQLLQAIGHFAYTLVDSIQWVGYSSWLSQTEGVHVYLEAYLKHWLVLTALMVFTWQITKCCMH